MDGSYNIENATNDTSTWATNTSSLTKLDGTSGNKVTTTLDISCVNQVGNIVVNYYDGGSVEIGSATVHAIWLE